MDSGKALDAGCDVGEERWLRDIVQSLQLTNQDPAREWVLCHSGTLVPLISSLVLVDIHASCLPGNNVQNWKEDDKGPHSYKEPRENSCDHSDTEEHQDNILDEHLGLKWQAYIDWGIGKGTSVRVPGLVNKRLVNRAKHLKKQEVPQNSYLKFVILSLIVWQRKI